MVADRPEGLADQGARLREVGRGKPVPARACRVRAGPARAAAGRWSSKAKDKPEVAEALAAAWKREKAVAARQRDRRAAGQRRRGLPRRPDRGGHGPRGRGSASPRSAGWPGSSATTQAEAILRAAWTNPKEAYGARKAALAGLVGWKVKDADEVARDGPEDPGRSTTRSPPTALELLAGDTRTPRPASWPRSTASTASRKRCDPRPSAHSAGWPRTTRRSRISSSSCADDPDRSVRLQAWMTVRELKLKKALPVLEARLGRDHLGFAGFTRDMLRGHDQGAEGSRRTSPGATTPRRHRPRPSPSSRTRLAELEQKTKRADEVKSPSSSRSEIRRAGLDQRSRRRLRHRAGRTDTRADRQALKVFSVGKISRIRFATMRCSSSRSVQTAIRSPCSPSASTAIDGSPSRSWRTTSAADRATCQRLHSSRRWGEWLAISGTSRRSVHAGDLWRAARSSRRRAFPRGATPPRGPS